MYKGRVKNIIGSGAAFISCDELENDVYCNNRFVENYNLNEGDWIEFESRNGQRGLELIKLKKIEAPLNPLFEFGLKIDQLTTEQYDKFCELCRNYVRKEQFKKNVTTSKIRNIFSAIQSAKDVKQIKLLRPKLAYLAGRDPGTKPFMNDLDNVIKKVKTDNEVKNFKSLFEAIICYKKEIEKN